MMELFSLVLDSLWFTVDVFCIEKRPVETCWVSAVLAECAVQCHKVTQWLFIEGRP